MNKYIECEIQDAQLAQLPGGGMIPIDKEQAYVSSDGLWIERFKKLYSLEEIEAFEIKFFKFNTESYLAEVVLERDSIYSEMAVVCLPRNMIGEKVVIRFATEKDQKLEKASNIY